MLTNTKNINTFLPVFSGFYNSLFEIDIYELVDSLNDGTEKEIDIDNVDFDYKEYEKDVSNLFCEILKDKLKDFVHSIDFEKIHSPKYYNYSNDVIYCAIAPNAENIKRFIYDNKTSFVKYLKDSYTSCDGFIASHSNDFETWKKATNNFSKLDINTHCLGSILDFICNTLKINEIDIYYEIHRHISDYDYLIINK